MRWQAKTAWFTSLIAKEARFVDSLVILARMNVLSFDFILSKPILTLTVPLTLPNIFPFADCT